jgi:protein required for attachment to host cells
MPSLQTSDVTFERLQRLAAVQAPDGARVLSLYLNLDPQANLAAPANRRSAVNSLLDEAGRAVEGQERLDHAAHVALREDVTRAREELDANLDDGWAEGAHALAIFVCGPGDLFEVLKLPRAVDNRVVIAERPAVLALAESGPSDPWAVLVFDGNDARLLEGHGDALVQVDDEHSDHGGRTSRGGRSAARYERSVGMEEHEFLREVADMLQDAAEQHGYERIFVGTTERHYGEFVGLLEQHTREKVVARFDAGADWEAPHDLREKLEPLLVADETHREHDALQKTASPHSGVRGLAATLPALYERRVATLLIEPGLQQQGVVCPRCRWAAEDQATCPVDGETMVPVDLVEWAVERAIEGDAAILPVRRHNDLSDSDGIAAVLRF